jgi:SAM-dependent methyltransferase
VNKKSVHGLNKAEIISKILQLRNSGGLYDLPAAIEDNDLFSSLDRFSDIALRLRDYKKVLDVGAGTGILVAILSALGHEVYAVDFFDKSESDVYLKANAKFQICNIEADPLPFEDQTFDAVCCCQALEHFTHAHLPSILEMKRVLRIGGVLEIDVPNAACFRNRWRLLRGKHITWEYKEHYLVVKPNLYKNREYYPNRHNREFVKSDLVTLYETAKFSSIEVDFLRDERIRQGWSKLQSLGSWIRNAVPSTRKSLIGFGVKGS